MTFPLDAPASSLTLIATVARDYGWTEAPLAAGLARVRIATPRGFYDSVCRLLTRENRRVFLAQIQPDETSASAGPAETLEALFHRYLDLSLLERLALWGLARPARADGLLCVTPEAARLLDARREVVWGDLAGPDAESAHALLRQLETPPAADSAALTEGMRRWSDLNAGPLGRALHWGRGETERFLRQALLGLRRLAAEPRPDSLGLTFAPPSGAEEPGRLTWAPGPAAAWLGGLLAAAAEFAPEGAGGWSALERRAIARQLDCEEGRNACEALRDGLVRLAWGRTSAAVLLGLWLPPEPERTAWRLGLTQPLDVREDVPSADLYVFAPLRLDPRECGMGRVLEAFEKLARHAAAEMRALARAGGRQLDLFARETAAAQSRTGVPPVPSPQGLSRLQGTSTPPASSQPCPNAPGIGQPTAPRAEGPCNWVCRHALRVTAEPGAAARDIIGYLIALHALDVQAADRQTEERNDAPIEPLDALPWLFAE